MEKKISLLKASKFVNGRKFDNLYLRIGEGKPIQICLRFFNPKLNNLLLANAEKFELEDSKKDEE